MDFDLVKFTLSPTVEEFDRCRKGDLILIAEFFNIPVSKEAKKQCLKDELYRRLVQAGILPADSNVGGEVVSGEFISVHSKGGDSGSDPLMPLRLKELELELKRQEHETQLLKLKALEIEADRDIKLRRLDLEAQMLHSRPVPLPRSRPSSSSVSASVETGFDVSRYVRLVPPFREGEVDAYFVAFERIATKLNWPKDLWALLVQSNIAGKAQEACAALPVESSLDYDAVKSAVLRAYELVPEAYRQKFRLCSKLPNQTFTEFARVKRVLFEKWCFASRVMAFEELQELLLLEDFKSCVPEGVVVHINEQKVNKLVEAAVLADEYVLTHRTVFPSMRSFKTSSSEEKATKNWSGANPVKPILQGSKKVEEKRVCFYCLDPGHLISNCKAWKQKNSAKSKGVAFVNAVPESAVNLQFGLSTFSPFVMRGSVALSENSDFRPLLMLRDTGAAQSLILDNVLPFSADSYTGSSVLVRGIELGCISIPLHSICLKSDLVSGCVSLGVRSKLPVEGVSMILGNDLAGGKVFPSPIVSEDPVRSAQNGLVQCSATFPACAVTRAQSQNFENVIDLSDSFLSSPQTVESEFYISPVSMEASGRSGDGKLPLKVNRTQLATEQRSDPSLATCIGGTVDKAVIPQIAMGYFWDDDILMRWWRPRAMDAEFLTVFQIVLPEAYRNQILKLAHEHVCSGHLGVTKTYHRIARHFFWPGMKTAVSRFVRSCHVCQLGGKPNQIIPLAPLQPIPVLGEPFERLIIDCVGPLPKAKTGHQYLLTIMCASTRYPEAVPLRTIQAKTVARELIKFCSVFGLPRVIQSDQGSNFTSKLFKEVTKELDIEHQLSTAYHPETQGALERFHQTLKSLLRIYCMETGKDWVEGLPFLMFAVRGTVQESLGFSPAELVFGHVVRGPLKLLSEQFLAEESPRKSVLDYVSTVREHLHKAWELARVHLVEVQSKMKFRYDKDSLQRNFQPGDKVLVLLPLPGSPMQARFSGPYQIEKKLNDTNYAVSTPDRKRKIRVCHINMLKAYISRDGVKSQPDPVDLLPVVANTAVNLSPVYSPDLDGLCCKDAIASCGTLSNSAILHNLQLHLSYLPAAQCDCVVQLIEKYHMLFNDVPSQTTMVTHDIDVGECRPIKQHPYRANPNKRQVMKNEVEYLLTHGFAVPSQSPWSSPCLLVPKPDGLWRFCTDFRKVNSVTKADSFPLPRIEDCVDRVGSASFVTKLDLLKGYWQVPLTPRASEVSAFVTPDCFLQYTSMAFGMRNAPATFQRLMLKVLSGVPKCEVYLDDIVIYSAMWEEHVQTLELVFKRLLEAHLTLNLAKCEFAKARVTYLGKLVGQGQVRPVQAKIEAILDFPQPSNKRELRRFLGMTGYYRGFCSNFATVVTPLTDLLKAERKFVWNAECEAAFDSAKDLLCHAPVLSAPNFDLPFKLQVDASGVGAGAVLLQEDKVGIEHPVCYFSKKFTTCQRNYSTIEKEALALMLALQNFEVYLCNGSMGPIIVYTDHNPLVFLSRMANSNQRLMRWSLILQEFVLDIRYKKGVDNVVADALSRAHVDD